MRPFPAVVGVGIALILATGCTSSSKTATEPTPSQVRPRSTATLSIADPAPGAVITGSKVQVRLRLVGGRIVPQTTTHITSDEGHIHLMVDGKVISMTYGLDQEVEVSKGRHLLEAEFVAADHFPFNPRVLSSVVVTSQ